MSEVLFVQNGWIQDGRIQDGCHHQVEWEWMSLSQIELVWVRVFCANGWEKYKMNPEWQVSDPTWQNSAIIKLSQNEWVKFFLYKMAESRMADFKIAAIIKLSQNEWVKFFVQMLGTNLGKCEWVWEKELRWLNPRWQNSRWLPSLS